MVLGNLIQRQLFRETKWTNAQLLVEQFGEQGALGTKHLIWRHRETKRFISGEHRNHGNGWVLGFISNYSDITLMKCLSSQNERVHLSRLAIKPTKWHVRPAKTHQPGHPPSLIRVFLSAWRKHGSLATHWAQCEDSDQTGRMPRLIWVFARRTIILLVLPWGGSFVN